MFTLLLAGKVWGWIGEGRVDILEQGQPPSNPRLFHARLATSLVLSVVFDIYMLDYCIETVLADPRPGMMVIFTFEFAVLGVFSIFTLARYMLSLIQARIEGAQMKKALEERKSEIRAERVAARQNETADGTPAPASPPDEEPIEVDENEVDVPGWEEKRRYLFALEVFTDFIKLMIYIVFFTVSITFNGLPMHIMRDVYMTFASFSKRVADYVAYRKATSDMNSRYPDATTEEIRGDSCIVCREAMVAWERPPNAQGQEQGQAQAQPAGQQNAGAGAAPAPTQRRRDEGLRAKKLPCGHILHLRCLKAWLERQQVCPTCRRPVIVPTSDPAAAGQQGAGAGNHGGHGQLQGQPRAQRQGRARILNFGPVRIGFLNGPGDQIGNIVRQMQNQNQNQNAQQAGQDGNQQGPNHLGLQVPYTANNGPQAPRAVVPAHVQIQQLEQRLMQEAQTLGLEQQQLATLRAMEGELARLRSMQQQPAAQRQAQPGQLGYQPMGPILTPMMGAAPEPFHGDVGEQMGRGHERLPEGLVLPEGWTAMPLHRTHAPPAGVNVPSVTTMTGETQVPPQQQQGPSIVQQQPPASGDVGPTNEDGEPLFVPSDPAPSGQQPTQPATNGEVPAPAPAPAQASADHAAEPSAANNQTAQGEQQGEQKAPWTSEGWSFVDPPNGQPVSGEGHVETSSSAHHDAQTNGAPKESTDIKGKKAAVEDAPDPGT